MFVTGQNPVLHFVYDDRMAQLSKDVPMSDWCVTYKTAHGAVILNIASDREWAISIACELLDLGRNVREIGPTCERPAGNIIDAEQIRAIFKARNCAKAQ